MLDQTVDAERALSGPPWTGRGSLLGSAAGRATVRCVVAEGHGWIRVSTFGCGDTNDVNTRVATATSAALNTEIVFVVFFLLCFLFFVFFFVFVFVFFFF